METDRTDLKRKWFVLVWRTDCVLYKQFTVWATEDRMQKLKIPNGTRATFEIANTRDPIQPVWK